MLLSIESCNVSPKIGGFADLDGETMKNIDNENKDDKTSEIKLSKDNHIDINADDVDKSDPEALFCLVASNIENTEHSFTKWLVEMEQSLEFIEKRLAAESALINNDGSITNFNTNDCDLYSNVSEMKQMHMNYFEKIKVKLSIENLFII